MERSVADAQRNAIPTGRWLHVLMILAARSFLALAAQIVVSVAFPGVHNSLIYAGPHSGQAEWTTED